MLSEGHAAPRGAPKPIVKEERAIPKNPARVLGKTTDLGKEVVRIYDRGERQTPEVYTIKVKEH